MRGMMMDVPLRTEMFLDHAADAAGDVEVVAREIDGALLRRTWRETRTRALKLAAALEALGLKRGERVGALAWNTMECLELFYGVPGMGGVLHTINPRLYDDQLVYIANHAEDAWLAFDEETAELVRRLAPRLETVRGYLFLGPRERLPEGLDLPRVAFHDEIVEAAEPLADWRGGDERDAAMICYTSGTTGNPKGVVYSHKGLFVTTLSMMVGDAISDYRSGVREVFMPMAPLFHGGGWLTPFSAPLMGAKLVLPGRDYAPEALYSLMEDEGVTVCFGVPTIWMIVVNWMQAQGRRFSALRATVMSGSKPPRALQETLLKEFGVQPMQGWGMTETLGSSRFALKGGLAGIDDEARLDVYQFAGRRNVGVKYRIVDDEGRDLPHDGEARGHLLVRGPVVASGYLKVGEATGEAPGEERDWLDTGDIAILHPDGYIEIADRSKDVIKSGGEWISSVELENAAMGHPGIAEAAVIAVAHPKWQERPLLVCARRPGSTVTGEDVVAFLRGRVADWWLPDAVEFLDELPRTGTGKIWKLKIRDLFEDYALPETASGRRMA